MQFSFHGTLQIETGESFLRMKHKLRKLGNSWTKKTNEQTKPYSSCVSHLHLL